MAIDFNQLKTIKHAIFLPYFWGANLKKNFETTTQEGMVS